MNKRDKEQLKLAFSPPESPNKGTFLQDLPSRRPRLAAVLRGQAAYIRPHSWLVSVAVFFAMIYLGCTGGQEGLSWCAALTPFLTVALTAELARSQTHGMIELEMATRFSLRTVLLARMVILGLWDLALLVVLTLALAQSAGTLLVGLHLAVPYLASALLGLQAVRRLSGTGGFLGALGAACLVGGCIWMLELRLSLPNVVWGLIGTVLALWLAKECSGILKKSEEYTWN